MANEIVIYRCTECGAVFNGIGALHGHAEHHRPFLSFRGKAEELMKYTERLKIKEYEKLSPAKDEYRPGIRAVFNYMLHHLFP